MNEHNAKSVIEASIRAADAMYPERMNEVRLNLAKAQAVYRDKPGNDAVAWPYIKIAAHHLEFIVTEVPVNLLLSSPLLYKPLENSGV